MSREGDTEGADDGLPEVTNTGRVEAFSDGVFAIVVTLLVLELREPAHAEGQRRRAIIGLIAYTTAGVVGAVWLPAAALAVFVAMPVFYASTSEGFSTGAGNKR